ncbi:MAG TPA: hypothetical protein VNL14_00675 [Candidatus Acidoferrales bacterium]|nr:hypothetical protein [Candidatus Acidoferrales bacterium]
MSEPASLLMIEFLRWVASRPRTYAEAMDAWRSSCPRDPVWDDAITEGLIQIAGGAADGQSEVALTARGRALLEASYKHKPVRR